MANGSGQPELAIPLANADTPGPGNDESGDSNYHGDLEGENAIVTGSDTSTQHPTDDSSINSDFELLWKLRKYLILLAVLAVSVTYNAGLAPPGGFWTLSKDGHRAGDPVLPVGFSVRYDVFFYCNATALAASLILIILLLNKTMTRHSLWLRAMQSTMIVDLFSLIGAYAAGSCRAVKSSVYVLILVFVVFVYVGIHILVSTRVVPKSLKKKVRDTLDQIRSKIGVREDHDNQRNRPPEKDIEDARNFILMLVTFAATVTYQAGLSPPGGFWAENEYDPLIKQSSAFPSYKHRPATSVLRSNYLRRYNIFVICNSTSFVASLVTVILLLSPELSRHGIRSRAVIFCVIADLFGLIGAYAAGSCRDVATSFSVIVIIIMVFICFVLLAGIFVYKPVADWLMKIKSNCSPLMSALGRALSLNSERNRSMNKEQGIHIPTVAMGNASETEFQAADNQGISDTNEEGSHEHLPGDKQQSADTEEAMSITEESSDLSGKQTTNLKEDTSAEKKKDDTPANDDPTEHLNKTRTYLLILAILAVSLTYQSGLNPPGGFWSTNEFHHLAGDRILEDTYHPRFLAFFYLNAVAFVASIVMIILLLNKMMSMKVIKRRPLQAAMIVNLLSLTGAFVMGSCREAKKSIIISVLVCLLLVYVAVHVLIAIHVIPQYWRRQQLVQPDQNEKKDDKDLRRRRNLLLMLAILSATVTYQAGMSPPGGIWSDDENVSGKPGNPILQDTHAKRYDVFYYSNSLSFVSSVVITILLVNKESCDHGIKFYALRVCSVVGLLGLLIAYAAGSCRKTKKSIYLIIIAVAVLISLVIQALLLCSTQNTLGQTLRQFIESLLERLSRTKETRGNIASKAQKSSDLNPSDKIVRKRHKYLILLAILVASITYQAGLNPPGGFWSDGERAGNPVLHDINPKRYKIFFCFNSFSFMSSIVVIMLLLSNSIRKEDVPLEVLHLIMILDLLALVTAFAAGSCRKFRTSVAVYGLVVCVAIWLLLALVLSSGIAKFLRQRERSGNSTQTHDEHASTANTPIL